MALPSNWDMLRVVGYLVNDDNTPAARTIRVQSSQTRLQDKTSRRVIFPSAQSKAPAVTDGYFYFDLISDTDTDITPTGRQHKVTLLSGSTVLQTWFVNVDHLSSKATTLRFDALGNIVSSGGTQMPAIWLTDLEDFSDAPVVGGGGGSVDLSNYFTKTQTTAQVSAAITALKGEADPFTQYATNDELTSGLGSKADSSALSGKADTSALTAHTARTDNPHATTKAQVGLGNVDNTSDVSKPISTATQAVLDGLPFRANNTTTTGAAVGKVPAVTAVDGQGVPSFGLVAPAAAPPAPAMAGARTKRYDPDTSIYNLTPANRRRARAALAVARARTGIARAAFLGDSLTAGFGATRGATDPVSYLRQSLDSFGVLAGEIVNVFPAYTEPRVTLNNWSGATITSPLMSSSAATNSLVLTGGVGSVLEIVYSDAGGAFTYSIDGAAAVTVTPGGAAGLAAVTVTGLGSGKHTVTIIRTSGTAAIYSVGFRHSTGLVVQNAGLSGAKTTDWLGDGSALSSAKCLLNGPKQPDIVFIELGVNDSGGTPTVANFRTYLGQIVDLALATGASVFLVVSNRPQGAGSFPNYVPAIYDVADSRDVPLLDLTDRLGLYTDYDADGTDRDLASDALHLTPAGYAYKASAWWELLGLSPNPSAKAVNFRAWSQGGGQNLANGAGAAIKINTLANNDDPATFTPDLANNRVTVQRGGLFVAEWGINWEGGNSGQRKSWFARNGQAVTNVGAPADSVTPSGFSTVVRLNAGDVCNVIAYAGGGATILSQGSSDQTYLSLTRIGD